MHFSDHMWYPVNSKVNSDIYSRATPLSKDVMPFHMHPKPFVTLARTWLHNPQDHYMQSKIPSQLCLPRTYDLSYLLVCPTKPFHSHKEECRKIIVKNIRTLGSEIRIVHKLGLPCSSETINKDSHPRLSTLWGTKLVNLNEYRQGQIQLVRSSTSR